MFVRFLFVVSSMCLVAAAVSSKAGTGLSALSSQGEAGHWREVNYCGVNCAYTWLRMASFDVDYEDCCRGIGINQMGSSLLSMKNFLQSKGLSCQVIKGGPQSLTAVACPYIAHFETELNPTGHFVLVLGRNANQMEFVDGMNATYHAIPVQDFLRHWSGYLLVERSPNPLAHWPVFLGACGGILVASVLARRRVTGLVLGCWMLVGMAGESSPAWGAVPALPGPDPIAEIIADRDRQLTGLQDLKIEMDVQVRVPDPSRELVMQRLGIKSESTAKVVIAYDGPKRYFRMEQPETARTFDGSGFQNLGYVINVPLVEHFYDGTSLTNLSGGGASKRTVMVFRSGAHMVEESWFPGYVLDYCGMSHRNTFDDSVNKTNLSARLSLGDFSVVEGPDVAGRIVLGSKSCRLVVDLAHGSSLLEERQIDPDSGRLETLVVNSEFDELKPGCWLPRQSVRRVFLGVQDPQLVSDGRGGDVVTTVRVSKWEVDACQDQDFEVEFQPGFLVIDNTQPDPGDPTRPFTYVVQAPGQSTPVGAASGITDPPGPAEAESLPTPIQTPAPGWAGQAFLAISIGAVALLLLLWLRRWRRRARDLEQER